MNAQTNEFLPSQQRAGACDYPVQSFLLLIPCRYPSLRSSSCLRHPIVTHMHLSWQIHALAPPTKFLYRCLAFPKELSRFDGTDRVVDESEHAWRQSMPYLALLLDFSFLSSAHLGAFATLWSCNVVLDPFLYCPLALIQAELKFHSRCLRHLPCQARNPLSTRDISRV